MSRQSWHDIPPAALRDHGEPARIDRVWARLERDLPARAARPDRGVTLWIPAMGVGLFALGVMVGARFFAGPPPVASVGAEPGRTAERIIVPGGLPAHESAAASDDVGGHEAVPSSARRSEPALQRRASPPPLVEAPLLSEGDPAAPPPLVAALPPAWLGLADEGRYAEALEAVESQGGFDAVLSEATADHLMLLVDVARATGRRERAITALRRIVNQHGSDPNAPLAAWMLGNELGRAGDTEGASQAFAMYRALSPQGDFAQDALARQFEVAVERRDLEQAEKLADQYGRDFPDGPRREEFALQLEELRSEFARQAAQAEAESSGEPNAVDEPPAAGGAAGAAPEPSSAPDDGP